jgi:hypothetical protein
MTFDPWALFYQEGEPFTVRINTTGVRHRLQTIMKHREQVGMLRCDWSTFVTVIYTNELSEHCFRARLHNENDRPLPLIHISPPDTECPKPGCFGPVRQWREDDPIPVVRLGE